jgi:hypothetical protein
LFFVTRQALGRDWFRGLSGAAFVRSDDRHDLRL